MWLHILLAKIAEALQTLAGDTCTVSTTASPEESLELLSAGPARTRIVLHWTGDTPQADARGLVETRVNVVLQQPAGMQAKAGADMTASVSGRPPFYQQLEQARLWLRSLRFPHGAHPELVDCQGGHCGEARPLILLDKDGRVIPGLRQAEFDFLIIRCLPWVTDTTAVDLYPA